MQLTLEALDPATPASEVDALFSRIWAEMDQYRERSYHQTKTKNDPDPVSWTP